LQHPFKKLKPVKSRVSEDDFKKCGKQEMGVISRFEEIKTHKVFACS
jgi:hypothetical protein